MPASHKIDDVLGLIVTTWSGAASDAAVIEALQNYCKDIRSQPKYRAYHELVDFTPATELLLTSRGIVELSRIAAKADGPGVKTKLAIIVSSSLGYGLGRMYQIYRNMVPSAQKELGVFKTYREGLKWIGHEYDVEPSIRQ